MQLNLRNGQPGFLANKLHQTTYSLHSSSRTAVPCCAVLCCAVLCCAVLCCAVLCCAVLCCAVLCCAVLCCHIKEHWHSCVKCLFIIKSGAARPAPLSSTMQHPTSPSLTLCCKTCPPQNREHDVGSTSKGRIMMWEQSLEQGQQTLPGSVEARVHGNAHNASSRKGGKVWILKLLPYCPWYQITLHGNVQGAFWSLLQLMDTSASHGQIWVCSQQM